MNFFTQKTISLFAFLLFAGAMFGQTPFYTEDFADELPADWSAVEVAGDGMAASNWMWTNVGPSGQFAVLPLNSTSVANGWMIFDSDLNCSGEQDVWLVSPKLDLSTRDIVQIQFETLYARYGDTVTVEVSTDSMNWTTIPIMVGTETNSYGDGSPVTGGTPINPLVVLADLTDELANAPEAWFAFHFLANADNAVPNNPPGCGYAWQVDDVALFDVSIIPDVDLAIGDFFYTPASFAQPVSQVASDTFGFFADVTNNGATDAYDATLRARVFDTDGTTVLYETSVNVDTIFVDSVITVDIPGSWGPDVGVGAYSLAYDLFIDGETDPTPADNFASRPWLVTDDLWSKENAPTTGYRPGGGPSDWLVGNLYTTGANMVDSYEAYNSTFFALKNSADGNLLDDQVDIVLLEVNDDEVDPGWNTFDDGIDFINNPGLDLLSFVTHTFTTNDTQAEESAEIIDSFGDEEVGITLKPGTRYLLCANYSGDNNVIFHGFSEEINYFQISTVVYTSQWFLGGFGVEPAATLRMNIRVENTDAVESTLPDGVLSYYPNPTADQLNVDLSFTQLESAVNVTIADMDGRVILIDELVNISEAKQQYDISNLPAGSYIVRVATKEGTKTKTFVVAR